MPAPCHQPCHRRAIRTRAVTEPGTAAVDLATRAARCGMAIRNWLPQGQLRTTLVARRAHSHSHSFAEPPANQRTKDGLQRMAYMCCMRTTQAMHLPVLVVPGLSLTVSAETRMWWLSTRCTLPGGSAAHESSSASLPNVWPRRSGTRQSRVRTASTSGFDGLLGPERVEDASQEVAFERW